MLPSLACNNLLPIRPNVLILSSCIHNNRVAEIQAMASTHAQMARAALVNDMVVVMASNPITWVLTPST
ncbi:hypothetical protein ACFX2H_034257 [Malus domestica]